MQDPNQLTMTSQNTSPEQEALQLGVMNSTAAGDFLHANRRSNTDLYPDDWKKLPIPNVDPAAQKSIVALVDQILAAKRDNPEADISAQEAEIDQRVYTLYGHTREEIAIIDESFQERKANRETVAVPAQETESD